MNNKKKVKVCLSSSDFKKYSDRSSTVVVVDLLRATSVISTAFEYGIKAIIPVRKLEEALKYKDIANHIIAAERNTLRIEGFDYGNSPYHYMNNNIKGKVLALTTTNGTKAIHLAKEHKVITGSFINIDAVVSFLVEENNDVIILCSGWRGFFNLEDSIFAGALADKLLCFNNFSANCDSLQASIQLYYSGKDNLFDYLSRSSYRKRNSSVEVIKDTKFCLNPTFSSKIVPLFVDGRLIKA